MKNQLPYFFEPASSAVPFMVTAIGVSIPELGTGQSFENPAVVKYYQSDGTFLLLTFWQKFLSKSLRKRVQRQHRHWRPFWENLHLLFCGRLLNCLAVEPKLMMMTSASCNAFNSLAVSTQWTVTNNVEMKN